MFTWKVPSMNKYAIKSCIWTQLIGRILMYPIVPFAFLTLFFPKFEQAFLYSIFAVIGFSGIALPIYILGALQKCSECGKRIYILPNGQRLPELTKSTSFWYLNFIEPVEMLKSNKFPCHHCGNLVEYS